jgi:hypothetical protein
MSKAPSGSTFTVDCLGEQDNRIKQIPAIKRIKADLITADNRLFIPAPIP